MNLTTILTLLSLLETEIFMQKNSLEYALKNNNEDDIKKYKEKLKPLEAAYSDLKCSIEKIRVTINAYN